MKQKNKAICFFGDTPPEQYFRIHVLSSLKKKGVDTYYVYRRSSHLYDIYSFEKASVVLSLERSVFVWKLGTVLPIFDLIIFKYPIRLVGEAYLLRLLLRPQNICWDYFDDFYYGDHSFLKKLFTRTWEYICDFVIVLSPTLMERFKKSRLWDNASHVARKPHVHANPLVIGTIASLDPRFDIGLYQKMIESFPNLHFQLYGRIHNYRGKMQKNIGKWDLALAKLKSLPNFTYFGAYKAEDLDQILTNFDLGLMPYVQGGPCEHINPDKYYHYANAGLPILASQTQALNGKPTVAFFSSALEALNALERFASQPLVWKSRAEAGPVYSWDLRADDLLNILAQQTAK